MKKVFLGLFLICIKLYALTEFEIFMKKYSEKLQSSIVVSSSVSKQGLKGSVTIHKDAGLYREHVREFPQPLSFNDTPLGLTMDWNLNPDEYSQALLYRFKKPFEDFIDIFSDVNLLLVFMAYVGFLSGQEAINTWVRTYSGVDVLGSMVKAYDNFSELTGTIRRERYNILRSWYVYLSPKNQPNSQVSNNIRRNKLFSAIDDIDKTMKEITKDVRELKTPEFAYPYRVEFYKLLDGDTKYSVVLDFLGYKYNIPSQETGSVQVIKTFKGMLDVAFRSYLLYPLNNKGQLENGESVYSYFDRYYATLSLNEKCKILFYNAIYKSYVNCINLLSGLSIIDERTGKEKTAVEIFEEEVRRRFAEFSNDLSIEEMINFIKMGVLQK